MTKQRIALVTGADRGIGLAIACKLAANGWQLALHGLADADGRSRVLAQVMAAGASNAMYFSADLRHAEGARQLAEAVIGTMGHVDVLVSNAGMQHAAPLLEMPPGKWDDIIAVNLSATFHLIQICLPGMLAAGWGRIINIASVHGLVASANKAPYVASKFGLIGLTKAVALETAQSGVTVNAICPGWVETALIEPQIMARAAALNVGREAGKTALVLEKQPSGRMSQPEDIAEAVNMLCSEWAHNMTGVALPMDGGWTAQ